MKVFWIDLFCGAGGTSAGIDMVGSKDVEVVACVNHDPNAIASHAANYPNCVHFTEDIRDFAVVQRLKEITDDLRSKHEDCHINIWASLECTNYSKAKGGKPRDADSRTLAEHLFMYLDELNPSYLYIENVREFMAWGALDDNGKPVSRDKGKSYLKWVKNIQKRGFRYDHKMLNSADYGAHTARTRYFGQFARKGLPLSWPEPTHVKANDGGGLFSENKKLWNPVRPLLNLNDEGDSIFGRKKPLSENTLKRILAGLQKFASKGKTHFIKRYNGGDPMEKVKGIDRPLGTITVFNRHRLVKCVFLHSYYGNGQALSIDKPLGTITTKDTFAKVQAIYSVNSNVKVKESDNKTMRKIKQFMVDHGIVDIKMRMLRVSELMRIQGFPKNYILKGTKTHKKKAIGNSVVPIISRELALSNYQALSF